MESLAIIMHLRVPLTLYVFTIRKVRVTRGSTLMESERIQQRYIYLERRGRLLTVKWKKYKTSLPKKETSCPLIWISHKFCSLYSQDCLSGV
jgi:hypothetical protein